MQITAFGITGPRCGSAGASPYQSHRSAVNRQRLLALKLDIRRGAIGYSGDSPPPDAKRRSAIGYLLLQRNASRCAVVPNKSPPEKLQFHQFRVSSRVPPFLIKGVRLAITGKEWTPTRVKVRVMQQKTGSPDLRMGEKQSRFEELLLPHLDGAYNLARWLVGSEQQAYAVVREAYIRAFKEFDEFRGAEARAWLLTIVRKAAHHRIRDGQNPKLIPFAEGIEAFGETFGARHHERRDPLYAALNKLPVELREVLVLHEIEGWSYTRLASALEVPRATVLDRLNKARRSLRQELTEIHGKGDA
jgi:RNA polymerase sigma-70 factor, ECF subfamily